jgi:hypothetical protein
MNGAAARMGHQIRQRRKGCEEHKEPDDHRVVGVQDQRDCCAG